ncbi:MAG: thioredoxin family protein [Flavobacteriales bacterium]|jgi:hypothetical protein|nr:thioredoxin family protein [Flavobacteriales bacterium]MBK6892121.1 thioredoxin family protein [Flavobacteriales bacterium]MBK7246256.1 thioredoxin family protein [Flavobacteriales bacterium]MBK7286167.1 thioredoxin family protein [Flavobacteriales bacterium]MBK9059977.1 thioredoxin family protein [Flavobacteriales bacterium]
MLLKILALTAFTGIAFTATDLPDLTIGTAAPAMDVKLKDVIGGERSLKDIAGENGLLVIFSCNTCPFVIGSEGSEGWQDRYGALAKGCAAKKIGFALVNSNDAKRDDGDSYTDMQHQYKEHNYGGSYLLDQGHALADAFGARTTPHVFLFDKDMKLVYKGAIDDNVKSADGVKEPWLRNAITAVVEGRAPEPATTRNIGCSVKRE